MIQVTAKRSPVQRWKMHLFGKQFYTRRLLHHFFHPLLTEMLRYDQVLCKEIKAMLSRHIICSYYYYYCYYTTHTHTHTQSPDTESSKQKCRFLFNWIQIHNGLEKHAFNERKQNVHIVGVNAFFQATNIRFQELLHKNKENTDATYLSVSNAFTAR